MSKKNPVNSTAIERENTEDFVSETLPSNWLSIELSKAVICGKGKKPKTLLPEEKQGLVPYIDIKAFEKGIIDEYADIKSSRLINENDILVVWDGARFGLTGMGITGAAGSTLMVLKPVLCYPKYIYSFINRYYSYINSKPKGTGTPHVNPDVFWNLPFPIAPLKEQKRIVAKLDAIIPQIESVKKRLAKIPLILKRFRQSVLTAAVTGKLTEKWREDNPDIESAEMLLERIRIEREKRYKTECEEAANIGERKPKKIHTFNQSEVTVSFECPSNWINTCLGNLIYDFCYGTSNKADYDKRGTPVVRIPNVMSKYLDTNDLKFLDDIETNKNNLIKENDILIIRSNGSKDLVGKNCIVPRFDKIFAFASYLIRIRPALLSAEFVYVLLNSPLIKEQFFSQAKSSAGINNINTEELASVELSLPPLEEQKEVVRQVDRLFALADKVDAHYQKAKAHVEKLSQSVLAKAFRGELVPQDPNDEPAEKLLERILAEKARMTAELNSTKKPGTKTSIKKVSRTKK